MKAQIVKLPCQHSQEYGKEYYALDITNIAGSWLFRLPMFQYDEHHRYMPELLQKIVDAINNHTDEICHFCNEPISQ